MASRKITYKPKQATKRLLKNLQDRAREVLEKRFGLEDGTKHTLEAIGQEHGVTRERVRQIEALALKQLRKSDAYDELGEIFSDLQQMIQELGGVVAEEEILSHVSDDPVTQNHIHLYLVLGDEFTKLKEDKRFVDRWVVDNGVSEKVHDALVTLHKELSKDDLVHEREMITKLLERIDDLAEEHQQEEVVGRWLRLTKLLAKNPLGEYGRADSQNVKTRGIKDYAYLVMRKHGSPMHFREVAEAIQETFDKKAHVATCHNELIKDKRFVLVGRGVYALRDWGYKAGVVREVIEDILKKEGPLSREQIIDKVLKERYLKRNTILVNLQNNDYFKKDENGLYYLSREEA